MYVCIKDHSFMYYRYIIQQTKTVFLRCRLHAVHVYHCLLASTISLIKYRLQPISKQFALLLSFHRTFKRLIQPSQCFPWLYQYSKTFPRTFVIPVHTQSLPRLRDADLIPENWSLAERRFRYLERTVHLSTFSVTIEWGWDWKWVQFSET